MRFKGLAFGADPRVGLVHRRSPTGRGRHLRPELLLECAPRAGSFLVEPCPPTTTNLGRTQTCYLIPGQPGSTLRSSVAKRMLRTRSRCS